MQKKKKKDFSATELLVSSQKEKSVSCTGGIGRGRDTGFEIGTIYTNKTQANNDQK